MFEQLNLFAWVEFFVEKQVFDEQDDYSDVLFVNTAFDKGLATYRDPHSLEILGNRQVTDRETLFDFLNRVDSLGGYRAIFLDIMFLDGYDTDIDSMLYNKIKQMDYMVFARSSEYAMADSSLIEKTGLCDYRSTIITTNFSRYQYLQDGGNSVALQLYKLIGGVPIREHCWGLFYTQGGNLCSNCQFLTKFDNFEGQSIDNKGNTRWENLGNDIRWYTDSQLKNAISGKYIILGDFYEDRHDTYMGAVPGPVICYKALKALEEKRNIINWWLAIGTIIVYSIFFYFILWMPHLCLNSKKKWINFIASFVSFGTLFSVISAIIYTFYGVGINVFVPSIAFSLALLYRKYIINK